jgi:hypothetical protein
MLYPERIGAAETQDLQLAEIVFSPGNGCDFRGADVQAYDNGGLITHVAIVLCCVML